MHAKSSPLRRCRHPNVLRRRALSSLCVFGLAAGCATSPAPLSLPARPPPAPGQLRVELVFGSGADLDLYLTGPAQETVYFANSPARGDSGRLEADLRCDATADPRVETVVIERAQPGRYRVGVDHAQTCDAGGAGDEPFLIVVEFGTQRREARGEIAGGRFLPNGFEFELPDPTR